MESVFKYAIAMFIVLPMLFLVVVVVFSVFLVLSTIPRRNRDRD